MRKAERAATGRSRVFDKSETWRTNQRYYSNGIIKGDQQNDEEDEEDEEDDEER